MKHQNLKKTFYVLDKNVISKKIKVEPNIEGNEGVIAISFSSAEFPNIEELDSKLKENIQKINNGAKCLLCGRVFKQTCHAKEHVEMSHIEGLEFQCKICNIMFKNRNAFRKHKNKNHRD